MTSLASRPWVPPHSRALEDRYATETAAASADAVTARIEHLAGEAKAIHEVRGFNLNPATNVMNPRAEALLSSGLGSRPSLGYAGDKYEMGLEAHEEIEVIAAELSAQVFDASFAEIRVASGAMGNLYSFMATCNPGDAIIAPPASIGGHVTHHAAGCAGLYGLQVHHAPVDADGFTIDVAGLAELADRVRPRLITVGGSLNLFEHPVAAVREVADSVGAKVLFDAAHQCGMIAGRAWSNPLDAGAHIMTMSTYKSLGGPAGGLLVTNDAQLAEQIDRIAHPGMTANFDVAKSAALAVTMLDWQEHGGAYAQAMIEVAQRFAQTLHDAGIPVFAADRGFTRSHQFAVEAASFGGGQAAAKHLATAGFLASGIGLPIAEVPGDMNGLRIGTPELVRWGVTPDDAELLGGLLAQVLRSDDPASFAPRVAAERARFDTLHLIRR